MATKTAVGKLSGSATNPSIEVTVWDDGGAALDYDTAALAALGAAPTTVLTYPQHDINSIQEHSESAYKFVVSYANLEGSPLPQPENPASGTVVRRVSAKTKTKRLHNFIAPVAVYDRSGDITDQATITKWKIDAFYTEKGRYRSEGTYFDPLPETRTLDYYVPNAAITESYFDTVEDMVSRGVFNNATWRGRAQGSVQFVRFSAAERDAETWELSFGFAYSPSRSVTMAALNGGTITIPDLRGDYHYWTRDQLAFNEAARIVEVFPYVAVVGRVWDEASFSALNLPGG